MATPAIAILTAPAARVPAEAFLALPIEGERMLWDAAELRPGELWAFAGRGATARVETWGPRRIPDARARIEELLASTTDVGDRAFDVPSARVFGGLSFQPQGASAPPWSGFADASFALPRWLYCVSGESAFVRLAVTAREWELSRAQVQAELGQVVRALATASARNGVRDALRSGGELEEMARPAWDLLVQDALRSIRAHEFEKVVTARRSVIALKNPIELHAALHRMREVEPSSIRFAFERAGATFLGATPERLARVCGQQLDADALAGSIARNGTDDAQSRALLGSAKDQREHALVVEGICAALRPFARELSLPASPGVRSLRAVHHLWTPISATLRARTHVLDLVGAIHPSPAVCGLPREPARGWIAAHEPSSRGWYASPVGWVDASGDGSFAVAIRSALVRERDAWLFAGAGIVEGSDPALEYGETRVKQTTMLATLGVSP